MRHLLKQGNAGVFRWDVGGLDLTDVTKIEFIFRRERNLDSEEIMSADWIKDNEDPDVAYIQTDEETGESCICVLVPQETTYLFEPGKFYVDVRATIDGVTEMPILPIENGLMLTGLFPKAEVNT